MYGCFIFAEIENITYMRNYTEINSCSSIPADNSRLSKGDEYEYITLPPRTPENSVTIKDNGAYISYATELISTEVNQAYVSNTENHIYEECDSNSAACTDFNSRPYANVVNERK